MIIAYWRKSECTKFRLPFSAILDQLCSLLQQYEGLQGTHKMTWGDKHPTDHYKLDDYHFASSNIRSDEQEGRTSKPRYLTVLSSILQLSDIYEFKLWILHYEKMYDPTHHTLTSDSTSSD